MEKKDILQFGTGNFLRGFSCWIVQKMINQRLFQGDIFMIQSHGNQIPTAYSWQKNKYHVLEQGIFNGEKIDRLLNIDCIKEVLNANNQPQSFLKLAENPSLRFVISNTTEAGIYYKKESYNSTSNLPETFPGKLAALLYHRFEFFKGDKGKGLVIIPCELIENNGLQLKRAVEKYAKEWNLSLEFYDWLDGANVFCNSLVDRIVPGFPKENFKQISQKLDFEDKLLVKVEPYHFWAIEGPSNLNEEFPAEQAEMEVKIVDDISPYRTRKVRILNGAHTAMVPMAYLNGLKTVKESVEDPEIGKIIEDMIYKEIVPTLNMSEMELHEFANDVLDRFRNPFIRHELLSISLNSLSKFKVRVLPSMLDFQEINGYWPPLLCKALASLMVFYSGVDRLGNKITLQDDPHLIALFEKAWKCSDINSFLDNILSEKAIWGKNLSGDINLKSSIAENIDFQSHRQLLKN